MALDGKILARANARLAQRRREREAEAVRRTQEAYEKLPRLREIDQALRGLLADTVGYALQHETDPTAAIEEIKDESLRLQKERAELLTAAGLGADYTDEHPDCLICEDRGYHDGRPCVCLMALYREEQTKALSALLNLGEENFSKFRLDYYDEAPDPQLGISPRENMATNYELCYQYACTFGPESANLFFTGGPGLGKTFLSACIAKTVADRGFSVVYDTAGHIFSLLEAEKFQRDTVSPADIDRLFACDLLILDDLGTEMTTAFTVSALYDLINTRLLKKKKMVLNTNLAPQELRSRYSPQIASRIEGEFFTLRFFGRDIRLRKKDME